MDKVDALLGPLNPNKMAAKSAPNPLKVLVLDATGDEGFSVCKSMLKDGGFHIWGLVPNADTPVARELNRLQVRIVEGELNRPDTFQSQLTGMDGIFIPSDIFSSSESVACGRSLIDMCKAAGVGHIVFTALDLVPNGEGSDHPGGQILTYIKQTYTGHAEHGDRPHGAHHHLHWTILYPGWKFSKLITLDLFSKVPTSELPARSRKLNPAKELDNKVSRKEREQASSVTDDDGEEWLLRVPLPDETSFPGYAVEQLGLWVKSAFLNHKKFRESIIQVCSTMITPLQMADILSKVARKPVRTLGLTLEEFFSEGFKTDMGETKWERYRAAAEGHFERDPEASGKVVPEQWNFAQWAGQSKELAALFKEDKDQPEAK
ncbi:hypothetical protein I314_04429 [Cryptococcus bacillisporus CA1873]|uniref:NmrA-like domain-containing protein n=1 Tax=Cryptococcus bacillisporus CA1873 TaxID=1296111 RepID=A0ABR5B793_CRYGA|nr:hypothetical protein I314_04429 [Cryptococcus bacillisporus CA1873]|eukprot:KIR59445.1 hypothetical protein I314_04429 [Cryptococcus gattii CA1873]